MEDCKIRADEIASCVRNKKREFAIAGNINLKAHLWKSQAADKRKEYRAKRITHLSLVEGEIRNLLSFITLSPTQKIEIKS